MKNDYRIGVKIELSLLKIPFPYDLQEEDLRVLRQSIFVDGKTIRIERPNFVRTINKSLDRE